MILYKTSFIRLELWPRLNYLWFGLDVVIVFQFFKYHKKEFPNVQSLKLYAVFVVALASAFSIILTGGIALGDIDGVYAALVKTYWCQYYLF
jgi:hypothetical protein